MKKCPNCGEQKLIDKLGMTFCIACSQFGGPVIDNFVSVLDDNAKVAECVQAMDDVLLGWQQLEDQDSHRSANKTRYYTQEGYRLILTVYSLRDELEVRVDVAGKHTGLTIPYKSAKQLKALLEKIVQNQEKLNLDNSEGLLLGGKDAK